ncbi:hypothetical protein [Geovibrio ferrireducens]|uniref:hypothetical protein n=1 Tax=Geovibrio ferrireducens TaxID=46201 RepID=UPI00224764CE|nr:hypothetical protein [Geovibrio ferrireducens]
MAKRAWRVNVFEIMPYIKAFDTVTARKDGYAIDVIAKNLSRDFLDVLKGKAVVVYSPALPSEESLCKWGKFLWREHLGFVNDTDFEPADLSYKNFAVSNIPSVRAEKLTRDALILRADYLDEFISRANL